MKTSRIFLASSIVEFDRLRDEITHLIAGRNLHCQQWGVRLDLLRCEDLNRGFAPGPKQDELNRIAASCEYFYLLVGRDAGAATVSEFDAAYAHLCSSGPAKLPHIRVFFQNVPEQEITDARKRFREHVRGELGQYPDKFTTAVEVCFEILKDLTDSGALANPNILEQGKRERADIEALIDDNRRTAAALCQKENMSREDWLEAFRLYSENVRLAERYGMEWTALEEYASFLYQYGDTGRDLERAIETARRLDEHYTTADDPDDRASVKLLLGKCCMERKTFGDAEGYLRDALELFREEGEDPDAAETAALLGETLAETDRPRGAETAYREALGLYLDCFAEDPDYGENVAEVCRAIAKLIGPVRRMEQVILTRGAERPDAELENLRLWPEVYPAPPDPTPELFREAERRAAERTRDKPEDYMRTLAGMCAVFADDLREHHAMEDADALAVRGLELARTLPAGDRENRRVLAGCCGALARVAHHTHRPETAERLYRKSLELGRALAQEDPAAYERGYAAACLNLGALYNDTNRYWEAEQLYRDALEIYRRRANKDPGTWEKYVAETCNNLAAMLYKTGRTGEAELLYRESLEISRRRAREDPETWEPEVAMTCTNLAILLQNDGRDAESETLYLESLEIYRRYAKEDPRRWEPYVAQACHNLGVFELDRRHNRDAARAYFEEAMKLYAKYPHLREDYEKARRMRTLCLEPPPPRAFGTL